MLSIFRFVVATFHQNFFTSKYRYIKFSFSFSSFHWIFVWKDASVLSKFRTKNRKNKKRNSTYFALITFAQYCTPNELEGSKSIERANAYLLVMFKAWTGPRLMKFILQVGYSTNSNILNQLYFNLVKLQKLVMKSSIPAARCTLSVTTVQT